MSRRALAALAAAAVAMFSGCGRPSPLSRGLYYYETGRYRAALQAFDEAVREEPDSPEAYTNRGAARVKLNDLRGAIEDFTEALRLRPDDPEVLFNRGNAHALAGDLAAAEADFSRAIELAPRMKLAYFNRGLVRNRLGDREGARRDFARTAELERDPRARALLLERAGIGREGAPEPGGPRSEDPSAAPGPPAAGEAPRSPRDLGRRALDRELAGDRAGALADLEAALAIEHDPEHRAGLEALLRLLGDSR